MRLIKTTEEMISVMQAYVDGKKIECKDLITGCNYVEFNFNRPGWDWKRYDYRVKEYKYRPFAPEDACKYLSREIVKNDDHSIRCIIHSVSKDGISVANNGRMFMISFEKLLLEYSFDTSIGFQKCGIKF